MARLVDPPNGTGNRGKHYYMMWQSLFEIDTKYVPIKPIGRGAYGIVCSSINRDTNEKVVIKKIINAFENRVDALRTLRELKLLRHLHHENVIGLKDIMMPVIRNFKDVYLVYELMDTDLHQIIKSSQALSNDHRQYFFFPEYLVPQELEVVVPAPERGSCERGGSERSSSDVLEYATPCFQKVVNLLKRSGTKLLHQMRLLL